MKLLDAVTFLRTNILDDVGGTGVDWDDYSDIDEGSVQLRWNNEELVSNINEAINQVYRRILPVKDFDKAFNIKVSPLKDTYPLDPRILQVEGIKSETTGKILERMDIKDAWSNLSNNTNSGVPTHYIPNFDTGTITLYPFPSSEDTLNLYVYRLPLKKHCWDDCEQEIELREEFVIPMLWYAASLCYDKDEANTIDPGRALYFLQKFTQEFTTTSAYSDNRKRKTTNRPVRYGGL